MPPRVRIRLLLIHQPNRRVDLLQSRHGEQGLAPVAVTSLHALSTGVFFDPFADAGFAEVEEGVGDGRHVDLFRVL